MPGVETEQGKRLGLFWLRRAAELDHQFAKKKLQEGGYPETEPVEAGPSPLQRVMDIALPILAFLF